MGRPLNKKYFGNRNTPPVGGEGVASVTVAGTNNNYSAFPAVTFTAPDLSEGVQATGTASVGVISVTITAGGTGYTAGDVLTLVGGTGTAATLTVTSETGNVIDGVSVTTEGDYTALADLTDLAVTGGTGNDDATFTITALKINSITVTEDGAGYTSAPTVSTTPSGNASLTAVLASTNENSISMLAFLTSGSAQISDIVKQVSTDRYKVTNSDGTGIVQLQTTAANAAGECSIEATDSAGGTYYVTKLTAHKATLTAGTGTQFATGTGVPWTLGTATLNETVKIPNA